MYPHQILSNILSNKVSIVVSTMLDIPGLKCQNSFYSKPPDILCGCVSIFGLNSIESNIYKRKKATQVYTVDKMSNVQYCCNEV